MRQSVSMSEPIVWWRLLGAFNFSAKLRWKMNQMSLHPKEYYLKMSRKWQALILNCNSSHLEMAIDPCLSLYATSYIKFADTIYVISLHGWQHDYISISAQHSMTDIVYPWLRPWLKMHDQYFHPILNVSRVRKLHIQQLKFFDMLTTE